MGDSVGGNDGDECPRLELDDDGQLSRLFECLEEDVPVVHDHDASRIAAGRHPVETYQREKRFMRKDGSFVDLLLNVSILRERNGTPLYSIAQIEDITERKRAAAREESERRLALALDAAQMGMWDLDLADRYIRPVAQARPDLRVLVAHSDVGSGRSSWIMLSPKIEISHGEPSQSIRVQQLRDGMSNPLARRVHSLDLGQGSRVSQPAGRARRMLGTVIDITERKRAEEALQRSEQRVSVVGRIDAADRLDHPARRAEHLLQSAMGDYTGLTLEESYGEGWITPFHPDDRQRAWDAWQRATRHRDTYSLECRLRRADGVYQWWLIRGVPLLGANGEILNGSARAPISSRSRSQSRGSRSRGEVLRDHLDLCRRDHLHR